MLLGQVTEGVPQNGEVLPSGQPEASLTLIPSVQAVLQLCGTSSYSLFTED